MDDLIGLNESTQVARRELLRFGGVAGMGLLGGGLLAGCGGSSHSSSSSSSGSQDTAILNAAVTAEQLATTMYYNIITTPGGIYQKLAGNAPDQAYLVAGYEQELLHAAYLQQAGATPLASTFYFPTNMFVDPQTTVNTLILLEDAFIAAYLIGVSSLSSVALRVLAAQIMGVESEHRALGRVVANDLGLTSVSGLAGAEPVNAPSNTANNLVYERTFSNELPNIAAVVKALTPFVTLGSTGYSTTPYTFGTASAGAPSAGQTYVNVYKMTTS